MTYAKKVFDLDKGWIEDRTQLPHSYPVDIDVRKPSAADRRMWIYWGSAKNIEQAEQKVNKMVSDPEFEVRFVDPKTGQVLKKLDKGVSVGQYVEQVEQLAKMNNKWNSFSTPSQA